MLRVAIASACCTLLFANANAAWADTAATVSAVVEPTPTQDKAGLGLGGTAALELGANEWLGVTFRLGYNRYLAESHVLSNLSTQTAETTYGMLSFMLGARVYPLSTDGFDLYGSLELGATHLQYDVEVLGEDDGPLDFGFVSGFDHRGLYLSGTVGAGMLFALTDTVSLDVGADVFFPKLEALEPFGVTVHAGVRFDFAG